MKHPDAFMAVLMLALGATILFCVWRARRGHIPFVRRISGITALEEAVGRATEMGRPIIFGMGWTDIRSITTHAALSVLSHVARLAARMRTDLIVLARPENVYPVAEQVVREAYIAEGAPELFNAERQVRFLSSNSVVYSMGLAGLVEETEAGCAMFFGEFDFTSLLMAEPGARMGVLQIAGAPSLWQVPFFVVTCDHVVLGEEYFAAGAYLSPDPSMRGALLSQDIIKLIFASLIVVGTVLALMAWWEPAQWVVEHLRAYETRGAGP